MKYNELIRNEHYITDSPLAGIFNTLILIPRRLLKLIIFHGEEKREKRKKNVTQLHIHIHGARQFIYTYLYDL